MDPLYTQIWGRERQTKFEFWERETKDVKENTNVLSPFAFSNAEKSAPIKVNSQQRFFRNVLQLNAPVVTVSPGLQCLFNKESYHSLFDRNVTSFWFGHVVWHEYFMGIGTWGFQALLWTHEISIFLCVCIKKLHKMIAQPEKQWPFAVSMLFLYQRCWVTRRQNWFSSLKKGRAQCSLTGIETWPRSLSIFVLTNTLQV